MHYRAALTVVLLIILAAPLAAEQINAQAQVCALVDIGTESMYLADPDTALSVTEFSDLRMRVRFKPEIVGDHLLELRLITPRGHHYQTLTAAISTSTELAGARRAVAGFPRALPVQVLQPVQVSSEAPDEPTQLGTELSIPVAGTTIVTSSLYGTWRIEVFLDGSEITCLEAEPAFYISSGADTTQIYSDGFESGDTAQWSESVG